mmetsp:Transcript_11404/g.22347  ORF Transcript_11404/g.22347 Transcript_11404/m.22347 type:complete len:273 (+) Transcript_11404:217-1035(+)
MANKHHRAAEGLQCVSQGSNGILIQVVSRLIKNDHVRACPHGGSKHKTGTLTTRHPANLTLSNISINTELSQVLDELRGSGGANISTRSSKLELLIEEADHLHDVRAILGKTLELLKRANITVGSLLGTTVLANLVEELLGADNTGNDLSKLTSSLHHSLVLLGQLYSDHLGGLLITTLEETILNVLARGRFQVTLQVVEGVLANVCSTQVVVLPELATVAFVLVKNELTDEKLEQSTLTSTVGTKNSHTTVQGQLHSDIREDHAFRTRVTV